MHKEIHTAEYYIASIDLLGAKDIIESDKDDMHLNNIYNIFHSWARINKDDNLFNPKDIEIKFFSDNLVLAIRADIDKAADNLLDTVAYMCFHFLKNGYKPRGGIVKGKLYIDDVFVWGKGLVKAYVLESKEAIYPRILVDDNVLNNANSHCVNTLIFTDEKDDRKALNYLRCFGRSKKQWPSDIESIVVYLLEELKEKKAEEGIREIKNPSVVEKIQWLINYAEINKAYWEKMNLK